MKCPCKECIVYAICINKKESGCELTDKYIGKSHHSTEAKKRIREVRDFLKRGSAVPHIIGMDGCVRFYNVKWFPAAGSKCAK